jgi:hypothetical protein
MSSRHRDEIRPPIASGPARIDARVEPDEPFARDAQMACLARIALVRRRVVIEPDDRPQLAVSPPRPDFARPPRRPEPPPGDRGVWCFRPSDDRVEVVELPDED